MIAIEINKLGDSFKRICDMVADGETIIVSRPHNQNIVVISEHEYNLREKALKNIEYIGKIDHSMQEARDGKTISFTMDELEAFETMSIEETKAFAKKRKEEEGAKKWK